MTPVTKYTKSGDINIAYQVLGDGPLDLVFVHPFVSHLEQNWEDTAITHFLRRLASFSRLILFDKRGTGMSDRVPVNELPTLEERMDDVRAVMDAAGSVRAALMGASEGGPMSALFAATYPDRTTALVLYGTYARGIRDETYPWGLTAEQVELVAEIMEQSWETGPMVEFMSPTAASDPALRESFATYHRRGASRGGGRALFRMNMEADVRNVLPVIAVPTLVLHRAADITAHIDGGRYIAERIPGAQFVELPGNDHVPWYGDVDALVDEVETFLTGVRPAPEPDRLLATVMFTDIVRSTELAAEMGDSRWKALLEAHNGVVREQLATYRGREVKSTGDGFLATFDGPGRGVRCAHAISEAVGPLGIEVRAGLHTGECELLENDIGGIAVHIAARVASLAGAGEVLTSSTVKDLVAGSGLEFEDRGVHELKGVPQEWRLYAVR